MPRFTANLSMLFTEKPFLERFSMAANAGFSTIEFLFPYEYPVPEIKKLLQDNHLQQVLFNLPAGNWATGDRGIAANPDRISEFRTGVGQAIEYAQALDVKMVNCLVGKKQSQYSEEDQWQVLQDNLRFAADSLKAHGLSMVIEPINQFDIPGFFINRTGQASELIDEIGMPNIFIQFDIYHAQRQEGDLTNTLRTHINKIRHIQIADNPGRHQPGTGEINYPFLFKAIDELGYQGYIGLEYIPYPDTLQSLNWINQFGYHL